MSSILINDIFEELSEENKRLLNELMFANKCLNVLIRFKTFIDFIFNKIETNLDSNNCQKFKELRKEVEDIFEEKEKITNQNIKEENQSKQTLPLKSTTSALNSSERFEKTSKNSLNEMILPNDINSKESEDFVDNYESIFDSNDSTEEESFKSVKSVKIKETFDLKKRFVCESVGCGKAYTTSDRMKRHFRTHFLEESLKCEIKGCEYRTWERIDFTNHMNVHKGIRPHVCTDCDKSFTTRKYLKIHIKNIHSVSEEWVICQICDKQFKNKKFLNSHQKAVHNNHKKLVCDHPNCGFRASFNSEMNSHKKRKHSIIRPFICDFKDCAKDFKTQADLNYHAKLHYLERIHKCPNEGCGKAFKTNKELKKHEITHSDAKEGYACEWPGCDFKTNRPSTLFAHKTVHLSERKFVCDWPQCGKTFPRKQQLTIHIRIHNCDKKYVCHWPGCQYRCVESSNLCKHLRIHRKK